MLCKFWKGINVQNLYLDQTPAIQIVENWFAKFQLEEFNLKDKPSSGQPSDIDGNVLHTLVLNNSTNFNSF